MEKNNVWGSPGEIVGKEVEHKVLLKESKEVRALYYKLYNVEKDVMDGAHPHASEYVLYMIEGEAEVNVAGEGAILRKGDLITVPANAVIGYRAISYIPAEMLVVTHPVEGGPGEHSH